MKENVSHLTIEELAEQVAIPIRTIRYYISEGLLPRPEGRGKATSYSEEHLLRLRLIRLLSQQHRPLAEIHQILRRLSSAEVGVLLAEEEQRMKELGVVDQEEPQKYVASLLKHATVSQVAVPGRIRERSASYEFAPKPAGNIWKRWEIAPGIELHVSEEAEDHARDLLERIWQAREHQ